jgi:heat shock protein HslJ
LKTTDSLNIGEFIVKKQSMVLIGLMIVMAFLVACGGSTATSTETPATVAPATEAPATVAPTAEAAAPDAGSGSAETGSYLDQLTHTPDPNLINITWAWEKRDNSDGSNVLTVPNPPNYTLLFNEDGSFAATIDCNSASGGYATDGSGGIFMELGPSTMVACPEESLANDMMGIFGGAVQDYTLEENGTVLKLNWAAGGPVDTYRNIEAPAAGGDSGEHTPDPLLIDKTWLWERRDPNGNQIAEIKVPNPENYTLLFNEDGTFNAKLDCNNGSGSYATTPPGGIFMELGPMTKVACPDGSLSNDMINMFGPAQDYRIEGDGAVLVFNWAAGGPIDYYRNASVNLPTPDAGVPTGTVTAPDGVFLRSGPGTNYPYIGAAPFGESGEIIGVSEDGQWWLFAAPQLPSGQIWVSAEFVSVTGVENVPVVTAPSAAPALAGTPWEWVATTNPATGTEYVTDPTRYVIVFNTDNTANITADCNKVSATYTADGSSITITPGASTFVACPSDSQADQFLAQLSASAIYFIDGANLYLDLPADSGTMRFVPQGTPPPTPNPPAGAGDSKTFYVVSFGSAGAEQPIVAGSQITASFINAQITGNAGCNNYSGTLTPVGDYFTISNVITTRMLCNEPAGVMEQEQSFLAALQGVNGYQWQVNADSSTTGQLSYTLADGTVGVMTLTTQP